MSSSLSLNESKIVEDWQFDFLVLNLHCNSQITSFVDHLKGTTDDYYNKCRP